VVSSILVLSLPLACRLQDKSGALILFGCVHMISGHNGSAPGSPAKGRFRKLITVGALVLFGLVLVWFVARLTFRKSEGRPLAAASDRTVARLIHTVGMVLVQGSGKGEWREVGIGTRLMEGDLIRTDTFGEAAVRYGDGNVVTITESTVFTVERTEGNRMEISALPGIDGMPVSRTRLSPDSPGTKGARPFIELQRIIRYGRSLELIGQVETGSSLDVNDEIVEVGGDGSFKHFTKPFPEALRMAHLNLKVTNLAGRTRVWTAMHDFGSNDGED
jgi:hypothetical protein